MIPRHLEPKLRAMASSFPVVTLTGPRQSGKTTLVRSVFPGLDYVSLEDPAARQVALDDPRGFLSRYRGPVIIDEAQYAPELFSYIQLIVDDERQPGRFILTGSQNFLLLERITQSLAGRTGVLHLLPFTLDELRGRPLRAPDVTLALAPGDAESYRRDDLYEVMRAGFYPPLHDRAIEPRDFYASYVETYLARDVRSIVNVGDLAAFQRFLSLVAARNGQLLNLSALASDADIAQPTARRWLSVLEASFVVALLPAHHMNFRKRLVKAPKLTFLDIGLACYLMQIHSAEELDLHPQRGALFEGFVVAEIVKRAHHAGYQPRLCHWRDSSGREVDVVVDRGLRQIPIEVKSSQTFRFEQTRNLVYWQKLAGERAEGAGLIYAGDQDMLAKGVRVMPWWAF